MSSSLSFSTGDQVYSARIAIRLRLRGYGCVSSPGMDGYHTNVTDPTVIESTAEELGVPIAMLSVRPDGARMLRIHAIFIKPAPGAAMQAVEVACAMTGSGLLGDCNANSASPRQVLLVDRRSIDDMALAGSDLRANLVVEGYDLERVRSGAVLAFGEPMLRVTIPCEPCGKLNGVRPGLSRDVGARRGVLARVLSGGTLRVGGYGFMRSESAPPLALDLDWRVRVRDIVARIPEGKVITYAELAVVAGVQSVYCRTFPAVLRSMVDAPVHRVVPADLRKIDARHLDKLSGEGVNVGAGTVARWDGGEYFEEQECRYFEE